VAFFALQMMQHNINLSNTVHTVYHALYYQYILYIYIDKISVRIKYQYFKNISCFHTKHQRVK